MNSTPYPKYITEFRLGSLADCLRLNKQTLFLLQQSEEGRCYISISSFFYGIALYFITMEVKNNSWKMIYFIFLPPEITATLILTFQKFMWQKYGWLIRSVCVCAVRLCVVDGLSHGWAVEVGWGSSSEIRWLLLDGLPKGGILLRVWLSIGVLGGVGLSIGGLSVGGLVGHLHDDGGSVVGIIRVLAHDFLSEAILLFLSVAVAGECDDKDHCNDTSDHCAGYHTGLGLIVVIVAVTGSIDTGPPVAAAVEGTVLVEALRVISHPKLIQKGIRYASIFYHHILVTGHPDYSVQICIKDDRQNQKERVLCCCRPHTWCPIGILIKQAGLNMPLYPGQMMGCPQGVTTQGKGYMLVSCSELGFLRLGYL